MTGMGGEVGRRAWGWWLVAIAAQAVWAYVNAVLLHRGPGADARFYLELAHGLLTQGPAALAAAHVPLHYALYPTLLAGVQAIAGDAYLGPLIALQVMAIALVAPGLYLMVRPTFGELAAGTAAFLAATSWELGRWSVYVLTDAVFVALVVLAALAWAALARTPDRLRGLGLVAVSLLVALQRPVGLLHVALGWLVVAGRWWRARAWRPLGGITLGLLLVLGPVAIAALDPGSVHGVGHAGTAFATRFATGEVIHDMPHLAWPYRGDPADAVARGAHAVLLVGRRVLAFWAVGVPGHSWSHHVLDLVGLVPIYFLALVGMVVAGRRRWPGMARHWLLVLVVVTGFHALTEVDYDHRYRAPALPFLMAFAGVGVAGLGVQWRRSGRSGASEAA